ncbi:ABC transporter ATP-binding protein [Mahella australiensis]|uniref:ABC transporter related protein n=1 Tax=Mahella australiensis (strain DSM 15567 / CIP 107919 / 50-1 BON) TaxID=697281 RepID=F3ZYX5_MAHA5|nr:ABC transporter ATP-binding protein [Mahella australiensis]AEE96734.1 ABC transporter related protein [Mahella australiensis 50-1 BON]
MLVVEDLVKRYGRFVAVDHLSMIVERGHVFGFVGPNGAGKTTTMRIAATLLAPTSGSVRVAGFDVMEEPIKVRRKIGYMPDFFGVYDNLKAMEYLDFYGASYGIPYKERQKTAEGLLDLVDLANKRDNYVDSLSRGMKQRLCLARSLMHDPELLILDEPASGMDPRARVELKNILKELKNMGKTILISSHILSELSEMCDSIGIIEHGRLVVSGDVKNIMQTVSGKITVKIKLLGDIDKAVGVLKQQPLVSDIFQEDDMLEIGYKGKDEDLWPLLKTLVANDVPVISFSKTDGNLEKVFMEVTQDEEMV